METWKNETSHCSKATSCNIRSNLLEDTNSRQDRQGDDGNIHTMREGSRKLLQKKAPPPPRNLDQATSVERALPPPALPFLPPLLPCLSHVGSKGRTLIYYNTTKRHVKRTSAIAYAFRPHLSTETETIHYTFFKKSPSYTPRPSKKDCFFFMYFFLINKN